MRKRSVPDPARQGPRPRGDDLPATIGYFGVPPASLSATLWQILPQVAVGAAIVLASCVMNELP